jgi:hypothetical protein
MQDSRADEAIVSHKTHGNLEQQHALFSMLRRDDPLHWTAPDGYRPFWTISRHKDVMEIEKQNDRFINAPRTKLLSIEFESKVREAMGGRPMADRSFGFAIVAAMTSGSWLSFAAPSKAEKSSPGSFASS